MNEFDLTEAEMRLIQNRKDYILKFISYVNKCVEDDNFEQASNYITCAADNITAVNGAIDYLHAAMAFEKEGYPEFTTIFD